MVIVQCTVFWAEGAFWRNCRQILRGTLLSGGEVCLFGICRLVEPVILVLVLLVLLLRSLMLVGGLRMGIWSKMRRLIFWLL